MEVKKSKMKRITLDFPEDMVKQIKIEAAVSQLTMRQICMGALISYLANKKKERSI